MMPRALGSAIFVLCLLLSLAGLTLAFANADALTPFKAAQLEPSGLPSLLGPITSAGRVGWKCAPERAAMAQSAKGAELPSDTP